MALKNIRVEPRREIIESAIGITAFLVILLLWALAGLWFQHLTGGTWNWTDIGRINKGCPWPLGMFMVVIGVFIFCMAILGLLRLTHNLGERICAGMVKLGWDPRPKQRYDKREVYITDSSAPKGYRYVTKIVPV